MEMSPEARELLTRLDEAEAFLREYRVTAWADWLHQDAQWIRASNFYGVEHLLSAFGGMGSLNDLVISPGNGDPIAEHEVQPVNARLEQLISAILHLAHVLERKERAASPREKETRQDGSPGT